MNRCLSQRGIALLVVMIFLILMSLFAANTFRTAANNIRVVGNMQTKQEGLAAAQSAIEFVLSSETFTTAPELVSQSPVDVDMDGDGTLDYVVRISPQPNCYRVSTIPNCGVGSTNSNSLSGVVIEGQSDAGSSANACYLREWNVRALVSDPRTGMSVAINQGIAVPSSNNTCP
jgi:hypothetical protein